MCLKQFISNRGTADISDICPLLASGLAAGIASIHRVTHSVLRASVGDLSAYTPQAKAEEPAWTTPNNTSRTALSSASDRNTADCLSTLSDDSEPPAPTAGDEPEGRARNQAVDGSLSAEPQRWSHSSLQRALKAGDHHSIVGILQSASLDELNSHDAAGRTPLMLAIHHDVPEVVTLLLERGVDANEAGHVSVGSSPLYAAVVWRRLGCAERLLRGGALVNASGPIRNPLHCACTAGDELMVELLLRFGADANQPDDKCRVPLHAAAEAGAAGCVRLLVQHGARVNCRDHEGITPLDLAHCTTCQRDLVDVEAALSTTGFRRLVRRSPATLLHLLDLGVHRAEAGGVQVSYKPLRDVGVECPFEAALVSEVQRAGRWELVQHPAVEVLLELTRQDSYFRTISFSQLFSCLVFVVTLFTAMIVEVYHQEWEVFSLVLKVVLILFNVLRFFKHLVELAFTGRQYFRALRIWPGVMTTMLTFIAVFLKDDLSRRITFSVTILMAFVELTLAIEAISVWKTTRAISSLLHVTRSIVEYLIMYSPLLIGFSVAFYVIFGSEDHSQDNIFGGRLLVMNMAAMTLGQVDPVEAERLSPNSQVGFAVATILFTIFVVIVPIVMLNLLLALTISDTAKFLSKGGTEFLKNLASTIAWNQHAIFTFDAWVRRLGGRLPKGLYNKLATLSMRLKWRSTLPRPSSMVRDTPIIVVDNVAHDPRTMRASVTGSKRRFSVKFRLQRGLSKIVEAKMEVDRSGSVNAPSPHRRRRHAGGDVSDLGDRLRSLQAALTEQRTAQEQQQRQLQLQLAQQLQTIQRALLEQRQWVREALAEVRASTVTAVSEQWRADEEASVERQTAPDRLSELQDMLQELVAEVRRENVSVPSGGTVTRL